MTPAVARFRSSCACESSRSDVPALDSSPPPTFETGQLSTPTTCKSARFARSNDQARSVRFWRLSGLIMRFTAAAAEPLCFANRLVDPSEGLDKLESGFQFV